ncbi:MAG: HD domain-containing protein [Methanomassiliicoccales archaeon]
MRRDDALALIRSYARQESNIKHMLAVGAIMRRMAHRLGENEEEWEVTGILHDIDFEIC